MAKFLSKHLGKVALMTAAALWASCNDAKEEKPQSMTHPWEVSKYYKDKNERKYHAADNGNIRDDLYSCLYGCETTENDTVLKNASVKHATFNESDVVIEEGSSLTAEEIYETTRKRIPGLRHIYRKYLKKKPEFDGMVILNLKIAASGAVENVDVKSSTTDYPEFDADIVKAVSSWMFPKSKTGGNVTIPFTFYVNE